MRTVDAVEYDLRFACNECGKTATRVRVLEPGEAPEAQDEFGASLTIESQRLCVEVDGFGGWTSRCSGSPQEILRDWLAGDFVALRDRDEPQTANRCFECGKWYCADHNRWDRIVYGSPWYDYYFQTVCPQGHERTVER
ncbi:MAG: hypothetical protein ABFS21_06615 [Actinomycetota bacterium]